MSLTVRSSDSTSSHEFACQFGQSFLLYAKNPQNLGETWPPVPLLSPAERAVTVGWHRIAMAVCMYVEGVQAFARVRAHAGAPVRA